MRRTLTTLALALALAGTGLAGLGFATPAGAVEAPPDEPPVLADRCVPDDQLERARARVLAAVDSRIARVDQLQDAAARAAWLTSDHAATIDGTLAGTEAGLVDLRVVVAGEDDGCELADEARAVIEQFRVYVVVTPQTRLTVGADRIVAGEERLDALADRLAEAIADAAAAGDDVTEAEAAYDAFVASADAAIATATPIGDAVLPLQPGDWPDPAQPTLEQARTALRAAIADLRAARGHARDVLEALG